MKKCKMLLCQRHFRVRTNRAHLFLGQVGRKKGEFKDNPKMPSPTDQEGGGTTRRKSRLRF